METTLHLKNVGVVYVGGWGWGGWGLWCRGCTGWWGRGGKINLREPVGANNDVFLRWEAIKIAS